MVCNTRSFTYTETKLKKRTRIFSKFGKGYQYLQTVLCWRLFNSTKQKKSSRNNLPVYALFLLIQILMAEFRDRTHYFKDKCGCGVCSIDQWSSAAPFLSLRNSYRWIWFFITDCLNNSPVYFFLLFVHRSHLALSNTLMDVKERNLRITQPLNNQKWT